MTKTTLLTLFLVACGQNAPAAPAEPPTVARAPEQAQEQNRDVPRVSRFELLAHPERAEFGSEQTRVLPFGEAGGAALTLGGWRTRTTFVQVEGQGATVLTGSLGEFILPVDAELHARGERDGYQLHLELMSASRDLTVYVGDEAIGYPHPATGRFDNVDIAIPPGKLTIGENVIQIRGGVGALATQRGSVALRNGSLSVGAPRPVARSEGSRLRLPPGGFARWTVEVKPGDVVTGRTDHPVKLTVTTERGATDFDALRGNFDVSLHEFAGDVARLSFSSCSEPACNAEISDLRISSPPLNSATHAAPRNVIVYLVDTLRADKLKPWNAETRVQTPGLGRFIERAVTFANGHTMENWTKPSVATLLTGLAPWQHNATTGESVVPASAELLSETLQTRGFHTGAFICNGYVSDTFGFQQGFRTWRNYIREGRRTQANFVASDVLEWLDARPQDKPFFLYVHTIDPHVPYLPPAEQLAAYDPDEYTGPVDFSRDRELLEKIKIGRLQLNDRDRNHLEALYDAEISFHDIHFGAIMEGLKRRGLDDNTMIVFTADHGEEFFDHDSVGHGHSLYEELLHIPFAIRMPGMDEALVVDDSVTLADIAPTVADALELQGSLPRFAGRSLLARIHGTAETAPRVAVSGFMEGWRSISIGRYKLIQRTHRRAMLYDLRDDPSETRDIAAERPLTIRYMRALLGLTLGTPAQTLSAQTTTIDAETDEQLRALGYVGTQRR